MQRQPALAAATIGAVLLAAILVVGSSLTAWTLHRDNERIQSADRKIRENLFDCLKAQAQAMRSSRRVGQRFESLDALARAAVIAGAETGNRLFRPAPRSRNCLPGPP